MILQKGDDDIAGHGSQNLHNSAGDKVDLAAVIADDGANNNTCNAVDHVDDNCKNEGKSCTVAQAGENVLTGLSRTKQERGLLNTILQHLSMLICIVFIVLGTDFNTAVNFSA